MGQADCRVVWPRTAPAIGVFETVAGPVARPGTPGVCYRGWRTVAFDGCSSSKAADLPAVCGWLGKLKHRYGSEGYPMLKIVALCETGTRALLGAEFGLVDVAERVYAEQLLTLLDAKMLLLNDRGFDSDEFLAKIAATGAQLLVRLQGSRTPARWAHLPDGTYLTRIGGVRLRIIDAHVSATTTKGLHVGERYLLATTLTDHRRHSATELIALYHERWEIESAFYALRHTLQRGHVLRSRHPVGLAQELWAQLTVYQLLRRAMADAVESRPGTDPDRASFTIALETAKDQLINAAAIPADTRTGRIRRAVLDNLLPPRRARIAPRRVKCPISRYAAPPSQAMITSAGTIAQVTVTVTLSQQQAPNGRRDKTLQLMRTQPHRPWRPSEIARGIGLPETKTHSLRTDLLRWTREGILHHNARGIYTLAPEWAQPDIPEFPEPLDIRPFSLTP